MKVDKVYYLNIDKLYQVVLNKENDNNYKFKQFGRNLSQLYNHVVISFDVSDITPLEYVFLKMISTNISLLKYTKFNDEEYLEKNFNEIYGNVLSYYLTDMRSYDNTKNDTLQYLPVCYLIGDCTVSFSGVQLISLIGMEPRDFFIKATTRKCVIEGTGENNPSVMNPNFILNIENNLDLKSGCISMLINNLYKYMMEKLTYIDIPSETFCSSIFDRNKDSKASHISMNVVLSSIRSNHFNINFIDEPNETILQKMEEYKLNKMDNSYTINNTFIELNMCTSLSTFINLFTLLSCEKFITIENFRLLVVNPTEPYTDGLDEKCIELINFFNDKVTTVYNDLDKYIIKRLELTKFGTKINYSLLLSLSDISKLSQSNNYFQYNGFSQTIKTITDIGISIYNALV